VEEDTMEMLRTGSSGEAVEALQKKLLAMGINPGPVDGIFGPKTDAAVRRFQEREDLQVDGIVGPQTFGALGMLEDENGEAEETEVSDTRSDAGGATAV
jgi:peptidoglycan hydrolase-like protein with peptidoglycan-binding domain